VSSGVDLYISQVAAFFSALVTREQKAKKDVPFRVMNTLLHTVKREGRAWRSLEALQTAPGEVLNRHAVAKVEELGIIKSMPKVEAGGKVLKEGREERLRVRRVISLGEGAGVIKKQSLE
jgi:hypothetical protein